MHSSDSPLFATIQATHTDWRAAIAEVAAEAQYLSRNRPDASWDFGVAFVKGSMGASVTEIARELDKRLGTRGAMLGVAAESAAADVASGLRATKVAASAVDVQEAKSKGLTVIAVKLPPAGGSSGIGGDGEGAETADEEGFTGLEQAVPFYVGSRELQQLSRIVCRLQGQVRVRGADEPPTPRGWRQMLGVAGRRPRGMLLFVDPLASKYVVSTVLAGLDLAFPRTVKFGGVCADLPPSISRLAVASREDAPDADGNFGVAGLLLPSRVSVHSVVSPSCVRFGPELRLTKADGQVVSEFNESSAGDVLAAAIREAGPLEKLLIERGGLCLGLEAPKQPLDPDRSKVYDDQWGSSKRAPAYATLQSNAIGSDWLVRSLDPLPNGNVVVRREDLKRVPPRVGPAWLRCQLHLHDDRWARDEFKLSLQRYVGARMMRPNLGQPIGALVCACRPSRAVDAPGERGGDLGCAELREAFGDRLPIARAEMNGEISPPGVSIGGVDETRTTRQGHTTSCCFLTYNE